MPFDRPDTCGVCWKSGKDARRWLQRDPATDPEPEPEPTKTPEEPGNEVLTRKKRRAAKYGTNSET